MKNILLLLLILFFLTSVVFAGTVNLPKTGQTKCWDTAGTEISCIGTGQDGEIQAGDAWPSTRFTVSGDVVTDNLTGLMWTKNAYLFGIASWQQALDYVKGMNAGTYSNFGYTDWRLPNVNELESLINANEADCTTWLKNQGFTNVQANQAHYYWSSTTNAFITGYAWYVYMVNGYVSSFGKYYLNYVWPVRGGQCGSFVDSVICLPQTGQTKCYDTSDEEITCAGTGQDGDIQAGVAWPSPRFTNPDGSVPVTGDVVLDQLTGLMWTKNPNLPGGEKTWQQTLDYVKGMNNGTYNNFGYTDWRLPNRKELNSLIDYSQYTPALPSGNPFTDVQALSYHLSSTTSADYTYYAWYLSMNYGGVIYYSKSDNHYVWPVRGGQAASQECSIWADVIDKYTAYVSGQAAWNDVISCYNEYATP